MFSAASKFVYNKARCSQRRQSRSTSDKHSLIICRVIWRGALKSVVASSFLSAKNCSQASSLPCTNNLQGEISESEIKEVEELVDESPIISRDILHLTKWMSDYYYAPWGECLRTALPAGATVATEQVLTITEAGRSALSHVSAGFSWSSSKLQALELLAGTGTIGSRELERQLSKSHATALIRQLERAGYINVAERVSESRLKPKLQNAVRLVDLERNEEKEKESKPLNEQQRRVIETIEEAHEPMAFSELLEAADVSSSVVRTLEKRGIVEVFAREVRRDPLAHIEQQELDLVTLNEEQQRALDQASRKD